MTLTVNEYVDESGPTTYGEDGFKVYDYGGEDKWIARTVEEIREASIAEFGMDIDLEDPTWREDVTEIAPDTIIAISYEGDSLDYIPAGLPEYCQLQKVITTVRRTAADWVARHIALKAKPVQLCSVNW